MLYFITVALVIKSLHGNQTLTKTTCFPAPAQPHVSYCPKPSAQGRLASPSPTSRMDRIPQLGFPLPWCLWHMSSWQKPTSTVKKDLSWLLVSEGLTHASLVPFVMNTEAEYINNLINKQIESKKPRHDIAPKGT